MTLSASVNNALSNLAARWSVDALEAATIPCIWPAAVPPDVH